MNEDDFLALVRERMPMLRARWVTMTETILQFFPLEGAKWECERAYRRDPQAAIGRVRRTIEQVGEVVDKLQGHMPPGPHAPHTLAHAVQEMALGRDLILGHYDETKPRTDEGPRFWQADAPPPKISEHRLHGPLEYLEEVLDRYTPNRRLRSFLADQAQRQSAQGRTMPDSLFEGDDWDELEPLTKHLLLYMRTRDHADLSDLCRAVWTKDYADVSNRGSINPTISKANNYLRIRQCREVLTKVRGQPVVRWE